MISPTNSSAETIVQIRSVNDDIQTQIDSLTNRKIRNLETIASLEPSATWEEIPDLEEPEEAPE